MKENIEEDIKVVEKLLLHSESTLLDDESMAIENILSDYKRVLKENEELKHKYDKSLSDLVKAEKENEELKDRWDKDTHKLQNDLDIANAEKIEIQKENEELHSELNEKIKLKIENERIVDTMYIPTQKIKDILNEINKEYIKQEEIFNKHFEKEERDMQDYYIQKEATNTMQELSWVEGKLQDLLESERK